MEIRRFGIGHRRPDGPPGTRGVRGALPIHATSAASSPSWPSSRNAVHRAALQPEPDLLPRDRGRRVRPGRRRAAPGSRPAMPSSGRPNVVHAAWTELTPMRAIVVEFAAPDDDVSRCYPAAASRRSPRTGLRRRACRSTRSPTAAGTAGGGLVRTGGPPAGSRVARGGALVGPASSDRPPEPYAIGDLSQSIATSWFLSASSTATASFTPGREQRQPSPSARDGRRRPGTGADRPG